MIKAIMGEIGIMKAEKLKLVIMLKSVTLHKIKLY